MLIWNPVIYGLMVLLCICQGIKQNTNGKQVGSLLNENIRKSKSENPDKLFLISKGSELPTAKSNVSNSINNKTVHNHLIDEGTTYEVVENGAPNSLNKIQQVREATPKNEKNNSSAADTAELSETPSLDDMEEIESSLNETDNEITTLPNLTSLENITDLPNVGTEDVTEAMNITTILPTNETTVPSTTVQPKIKKSKSKKKKLAQPKDTICYCDLTKVLCDVNCCCDVDCSESDKLIFTHCIEDTMTNNLNIQYCNTKQLQYKNYSPWLVEKKNNELFCIYKDNLPPKLKKNPYKAITSYDDLSNLVDKYYYWQTENEFQEIFFDNTKPYKYNDFIWVLINSTLKMIDVPTSQANNYCSRRVHLKYLINYKSNCVSALPNSDMLNIYNNFDKMYIISSPNAMNESWIINIHDCPVNVCLSISAFICNPYSCKSFNTSEERPQPVCENSYCRNMVTNVKFIFYSNGSMGFTNVSIYFGLSEILLTSNMIEQNFEINHLWISKNTTNPPKKLSGNVGYLVGKPIISSKYVSYKDSNSSETITILDYYSTVNITPLQNILLFPRNLNGLCVLSNETYGILNFRENVRSSCRIVLDISNYIKIYNASEACVLMQNKIMSLISYGVSLKNQSKIYISTVGNPTTDSKEWIELMYRSPNPVIGDFVDNQSCIVCKNLVRNIKYEFVYAHIVQPNTKSQINIIGAGIRYITEEVSFDVVDDVISTIFTISSMFYDVTKPQKTEYAKGPNFHINLPSDFFYPFTLNRSSLLKIDLMLNFALICMYFVT